MRTRVVLCALTLALGSAGAFAQATEPPAIALAFGSFFARPIGPRGLEISAALRAADGQRVRLVGFMVAQEDPVPGRFLLTPRPVAMSEHADGEADDLPPATVTVQLHPSQADRLVPHQRGLIALSGRLALGRDEDPVSGRVSWVRLHLDPQAVVDASAAAPTPVQAQLR
jgi:hypothetical protein